MKAASSITLWLLLLCPLADAATRTVTNTADSGPGSLRDAIAASASGDTIRFSASILGTPHIRLTSGELQILVGLTIDSQGRRVLIDGNGVSRVFSIGGAGPVVLSSLTITNGFMSGGVGGGVLNGGTLMLTNCTVSGNYAEFGGGMWSLGALTVNNCTFSGNRARYHGGAIYDYSTDSFPPSWTANNSTFVGNSAYLGGGIAATRYVTVSHCTFAGNVATNVGSAIAQLSGSTITMNNTICAGNINYSGGVQGDVDGVFTSQGFNLIGNADSSSGWVASDRTGTGLMQINALLGRLDAAFNLGDLIQAYTGPDPFPDRHRRWKT